MIEWLITNHHYIPTSIISSFAFMTILISVLLSSKTSREETEDFTVAEWLIVALTNIMIACILAFFTSAFFMATISSNPVSSAEWKTIYDSTGSAAKTEIAKSLSEDQKISDTAAASIAANTSDPESKDVKIKLTYRMTSIGAGDEIGKRFAEIFSNIGDSGSRSISITASKSDYEKSEDFLLSKENLISNGDIVNSSKIVKIEIRTADYEETNFFGFKGRNDLYQPKEVRITLESNSNVQQEVDKIFE